VTRRARRARAAALLLALVTAACGRYANVAQKLDVTARVAGDTWIARGADPTELRVLLIGTPDPDGSAPFSFSSIVVATSAGQSVVTLQGTWTEAGNAGTTVLHVQHEYSYPDESGESILTRTGTTRTDAQYTLEVTATRTAGQLVVAGDAGLSGTYVPLVRALGRLATATPSDAAACAFQIANVGTLRSEGRILGFGGPQIQQYSQAATYAGTVAGSLTISFSGGATSSVVTTTIDYSGFEDVGGVQVDGAMVTDANWGGTGHMYGVLSFTLAPVAADGAPGTPITGTIDYGGGGDSTKWIQIVGGNPVGGVYRVAIDGGGGTAEVPCAAPPSPSVPDCLALP